jgi:Ran GTPase-activating protein (RanGAP) involved in mRNA processing and transport
MANIARALDPVIKKPPKKDPFAISNVIDKKKPKVYTHIRNINGLSFKYCYLGLLEVRLLCLALKVNRSLVKLDLSNNAMNSVSGALINDALEENMTLTDLNLSRNKLCDMFAEGFAKALRTNDVIWRVDISENRFTKVGAKKILDAL